MVGAVHCVFQTFNGFSAKTLHLETRLMRNRNPNNDLKDAEKKKQKGKLLNWVHISCGPSTRSDTFHITYGNLFLALILLIVFEKE